MPPKDSESRDPSKMHRARCDKQGCSRPPRKDQHGVEICNWPPNHAWSKLVNNVRLSTLLFLTHKAKPLGNVRNASYNGKYSGSGYCGFRHFMLSLRHPLWAVIFQHQHSLASAFSGIMFPDREQVPAHLSSLRAGSSCLLSAMKLQ